LDPLAGHLTFLRCEPSGNIGGFKAAGQSEERGSLELW
jgi:hypothetical protein